MPAEKKYLAIPLLSSKGNADFTGSAIGSRIIYHQNYINLTININIQRKNIRQQKLTAVLGMSVAGFFRFQCALARNSKVTPKIWFLTRTGG
ncbi:hypothetical protein ASZ90_010723 [hydrocarbon metagenome]|uniref:Uncharacterized protein n=1 Tax=hydrocarbon metagenome TaxID=938273 RepID=A0A0W8FF96_9ZZZZ